MRSNPAEFRAGLFAGACRPVPASQGSPARCFRGRFPKAGNSRTHRDRPCSSSVQTQGARRRTCPTRRAHCRAVKASRSWPAAAWPKASFYPSWDADSKSAQCGPESNAQKLPAAAHQSRAATDRAPDLQSASEHEHGACRAPNGRWRVFHP